MWRGVPIRTDHVSKPVPSMITRPSDTWWLNWSRRESAPVKELVF